MLILFQNVERLFCSFRSKDSAHFLPTFRVGYDRLLEQVTREIRSVRRNQSHLLSLDLVATQILAYLCNQKMCFQLCHSAACNKNRKKPHEDLSIYIFFFEADNLFGTIYFHGKFSSQLSSLTIP